MFYTVSAAESLADRLAGWLLAEYGAQPEQLAKVLILLPSRRAIRTVREAFLRAAEGQAMLLPQLVAIGDVDETLILRHGTPSAQVVEAIEQLLPAPPPMERLLRLQELVWLHGQKMIPRLHDREAALDLAVNLAEFMDEMDREQAQWEGLDSLVPEDFAAYWQQTLEFLKIIRDYWPQQEQEQGWMRPWQRRNRVLELLLRCWQENPPQTPVIAAGATGSIPAVGALLEVIHHLPNGHVVLPGFEPNIGEEPLPASHPQAGMQELLLGLKLTPESVMPLPGGKAESTPREQLLSKAMLPASQLSQWQQPFTQQQEALQRMCYLEMEGAQQAAMAAALLLRETLETSRKTAAFITPDRQLARAVSTHLAQWGIRADDSAGQPLALIPQAVFVQLMIDAVRYGLRPVTLLAMVKHPLFYLGQKRGALMQQIRQWERKVLRGLVAPHWGKVSKQTQQKMPEFMPLLSKLEQILTPLLERFATTESTAFTILVEELLVAAEELTTDEQGMCHLWQRDGATELSRFCASLREASLDQLIAAEELPGMLRALMRPEVVRPHYGTHPRLQILSPMEARLQRYDRVVLADMNEAGWPQTPDADPWMNRQMRHQLGLPSPDKRMGLQAHDFIQQAAGGEVFLLRTAKAGGAETQPSRFIQRLETLIEMNGGAVWTQHPVQHWVEELLAPEALPAATRPAPVPPVEARPRKLSVTRIERLMQDPYSIYAQKILRLDKQEALDPDPSHREFGNLVHRILEHYFNGQGEVMDCAERIFAEEDLGYVADSLWWPRLERIARWVEAQPMPLKMHCEVEGQWHFPAPAGEFTLTAKLDRLEESVTGFSVIDYKTGAPAAAEWMRQGMASQLSLAAVMVKQGSFGTHLQNKPVEALEYWKLGGQEGGEKLAFATAKEETLEEVVQQAQEALPRIIAAFDAADKPYESIPEYRFKPRYNDYEHLARIQEWLD